MRRALILCLLLTGCANTVAVKTACLPLKAYTAAQQQQMANELSALPPTSALGGAMADYVAMRDADRACLNPKP